MGDTFVGERFLGESLAAGVGEPFLGDIDFDLLMAALMAASSSSIEEGVRTMMERKYVE